MDLVLKNMSKIGGDLECQNGHKIRWKINNFKFLHKSLSDYRDFPQTLESGHFKIWDYNWKFKLTIIKEYIGVSLGISLEVLDVESWDEKGLPISASLKSCHRGGDEFLDGITSSDQRLQDYKINYDRIFYFSKIDDQIRHDFDFTWTIWTDISSAQCKPHMSKRIKLMSNKWGGMLDDTGSHDVKIRCQGVEMTAHKWVLSVSSSVFKAMFQAGMKESLESVVEVTVGTPEMVKVMLRWIYTGEFGENEPKALELLKLAHYYDLGGLMEECEVILVDNLSRENVIEMLNEADLMGAKRLKGAAIQFIIRNKSDLKVDLETKLNQNLGLELFLANHVHKEY